MESPPDRRSGRVGDGGPALASTLLLGVLIGAVVATDQIIRAAVDSEALTRASEGERVRDLAFLALSRDLVDSDILEPLRDSPFELSQADIRSIFENSFTVDDVTSKATGMHEALVDYGTRSYGDSIPIFRMDIAEEGEAIAQTLSDHLVATLEGLPDCGIVGDVDALLSGLEGKIGLADDPEVIQDMPECRPTEIFSGPLRDGFRQSVVDQVTSHDSVDVLPRPDWSGSQYASWLEMARQIRVYPARAFWVTLLVGLAASVLIWQRGVRSSVVWTWATTGVVLVFVSALLAGVPTGPGFEQLVLGRTLDPTSDIGDAWKALILEFERPSLRVAAVRCLGLAVAAFSLAWLFHHFAPAPRSNPHADDE